MANPNYFLIAFISMACCVATATRASDGHGPHVNTKASWQALSTVVQLDPQVTITTNTSCLRTSGEHVYAAVHNVSVPHKDDMLALYAPATVDPSKAVPIQFVNLTAISRGAYLKRGWAYFRFILLNMRTDYSIKLVRGGVVSPTIVAESEPIKNTIPSRPTQGRLAVHDDLRSVVVQWVSGKAAAQKVRYSTSQPHPQPAYEPGLVGEHGLRLRLSSAAVQLGFRTTSPAQSRSIHVSDPGLARRPLEVSWNMAESTTHTYRSSDMCGFPADSIGWLDPGHFHEAVLSGLQAGARYHYQYGSEEDGWSDVASFIAPPDPNSSNASYSLKFLAFADVAQAMPIMFVDPGIGPHFSYYYGQNSSKLAPWLNRESDAQLALLVGDFSYAQGYAADWEFFGSQFERAFTQWPLMVAVGNHERDWPGTGDAFGDTARDSGGECGVPYANRFYTPAGRDPQRLYYNFSMGPVAFLMLDSEAPSGPDTPQGRFVSETLSSLDRSRHPWLVVALHRMMAAPASWRHPLVGDLDNMERLQKDYEELFIRHGVDLVLQGHEHAYARTCPMYKGECISDAASSVGKLQSLCSSSAVGQQPSSAPVYVLTGHAGAGFTHGFPATLPPWVVRAMEDRNGYLRFNVNATHLAMEVVSTDNGKLMDHLLLTKARGARPGRDCAPQQDM